MPTLAVPKYISKFFATFEIINQEKVLEVDGVMWSPAERGQESPSMQGRAWNIYFG